MGLRVADTSFGTDLHVPSLNSLFDLDNLLSCLMDKFWTSELSVSDLGLTSRLGKSIYNYPYGIVSTLRPWELGDKIHGDIVPLSLRNFRSVCLTSHWHSLDEIHIDVKLCFVEEPVEIMDREVKWLKRSHIPIIKVRWNSRRGLEFTWEREDQFRKNLNSLFDLDNLLSCLMDKFWTSELSVSDLGPTSRSRSQMIKTGIPCLLTTSFKYNLVNLSTWLVSIIGKKYADLDPREYPDCQSRDQGTRSSGCLLLEPSIDDNPISGRSSSRHSILEVDRTNHQSLEVDSGSSPLAYLIPGNQCTSRMIHPSVDKQDRSSPRCGTRYQINLEFHLAGWWNNRKVLRKYLGKVLNYRPISLIPILQLWAVTPEVTLNSTLKASDAS
nr:putative reverse transcriptase domain-containing protein [Tanacetum cinerariifolium]